MGGDLPPRPAWLLGQGDAKGRRQWDKRSGCPKSTWAARRGHPKCHHCPLCDNKRGGG